MRKEDALPLLHSSILLPTFPDRDDEGQAKKYADWLKRELQMSVDIVVIGGTTDASLCDEYSGKRTQFLSYAKLIADAQASLDWMLEQLTQKP